MNAHLPFVVYFAKYTFPYVRDGRRTGARLPQLELATIRVGNAGDTDRLLIYTVMLLLVVILIDLSGISQFHCSSSTLEPLSESLPLEELLSPSSSSVIGPRKGRTLDMIMSTPHLTRQTFLSKR
jgi:hypothetical protein